MAPLRFGYFFKCIYFGYSAIQVQLGYPKRIAGNFLMKRFNYIHQLLYRIYLLIPFLLELRTIMDWILNVRVGLKKLVILLLFICGFEVFQGEKLTKYSVGGTLLILLILSI